MAPPTTVVDNFNRANDEVPSTAVLGQVTDAHGWFVDAVTGRLAIVGNQVTGGSSGWCQAARAGLQSLPSYAAFDLVSYGAAVSYIEEVQLVIGIQQNYGTTNHYDQDVTAFTFRIQANDVDEGGVPWYIIGYGTNVGDGKELVNWVEGPLPTGAARYAFTVEVVGSNVVMTGWRNGVQVDQLIDSIANVEIFLPENGGEWSGYTTGYLGIRSFSTEIILDNWGGGSLVAVPNIVTMGRATEADTATVFRRVRNRSINQPSSANTALTVKPVRVRHLSQPTESDTATVFAHYKIKRMSQPSEADTANAVRPTHVRYLTEPSETDTATAFAHPKALRLTQPAEADTATAFVKKKVRSTTQPSEADTANVFGRIKVRSITQPAEADSATVFVRHKTKTTAQPAEADVANAMARLKVRSVSQATEADSATQDTRLKARAFGLAPETDASFSFTRGVFGLTHAIEADIANQIARKAFLLANKASEADSALAFVKHKTRAFGQPSETDTANTVQPRRVHFLTLGLSLEADSALAFKARRAEHIVQPSEVDSATVFGKRHLKTMAQPSSLNTALTLVPHKDWGFGKASESDAAQRINVGLPVLVVPVERDLALSTLVQRKIRQPVEIDTPVPAFTVRQTFTNIVLEIDSALALGNAQHPSVAAEPMLFSVGVPSLSQLNKTRLLEVG